MKIKTKEMDYAQVADIIVFYFASGKNTQPITLLELGMYAGTGKAIVCCSDDFYKKGAVQMVCSRYGIDLHASLDDLKERVRRRVLAKLDQDIKLNVD